MSSIMVNDFHNSSDYWVLIVCFILTCFLIIMPLPEWLSLFRPEWAAMMVIYWVIASPHQVGVKSAWLGGFFIDILQGSLMGQNALVLAVVAYIVLNLYQRLRMFTFIQQSAVVLVVVGIDQIITFWILTLHNQNTSSNLLFMLPALSSALAWPFVYVLIGYLRRYFQVK